MFAIAGGPSFADRPRTWNLFFARQPEPDLEFTEEWSDETTTIGSPQPIKPPKQSNSRPLLWVLFFVLIGGGVYVAMEPEMVTKYVGPLLGETAAPQSPVALKPTPPTAVPSKQPEQDWSFLAPTQPITPSSPALKSAPTIPAPLFSEGQRVSVQPDPTAPGHNIQLRQDAEGTKPGPAIPPGTVLTILDGDLQGSGWIYSVRSDVGTEGWLAEQQLKLKP